MSEDNVQNDPTNRVVCIFDQHSQAVAAKSELISFGFEKEHVQLLSGEADAADVDTSAKWFADTDKFMKKFDRELRAGATILSVPIKDRDCREGVHSILTAHGARHVTHFGEWITEVMK